MTSTEGSPKSSPLARPPSGRSSLANAYADWFLELWCWDPVADMDPFDHEVRQQLAKEGVPGEHINRLKACLTLQMLAMAWRSRAWLHPGAALDRPAQDLVSAAAASALLATQPPTSRRPTRTAQNQSPAAFQPGRCRIWPTARLPANTPPLSSASERHLIYSSGGDRSVAEPLAGDGSVDVDQLPPTAADPPSDIRFAARNRGIPIPLITMLQLMLQLTPSRDAPARSPYRRGSPRRPEKRTSGLRWVSAGIWS
jgi:hypothetical protein